MARWIIARNLILLSLAMILISCNNSQILPLAQEEIQMYKTYQVHRLTGPMRIDANWDKPQWQETEPLDIDA